MSRVFVLLLVVAAVTAEDFAMEGEEFSLKCSGDGPVQYWLLHGTGTAYTYRQTSEQDTVYVDQDGTLHFKEVSMTHEGDHLCVYSHTLSATTVGMQVNMRVRPIPSEDLWQDVYKAQFITGLISALVCAFIFVAGCLVFRFRYRAPKNELLKAEDGGHYNPSLEVDADSTRM